MASKDYYAILNVPRTATADDIKKAYHRLAMKWHPDKNPNNQGEATRKFKDVSEAYEVLSNENGRRNYDNNRNGGFGFTATPYYQGPNTGFRFHFSPNDFQPRPPREVFTEFFQGQDPYSANFGGNFSTNFGMSGGNTGNFETTLTETVNGKTTVRKTVVENGVETLTVLEDGALIHKSVRNVQ